MPLRALLQTPGVAGPFFATLVGRIPLTAIGLLLVLHVENLTGSFAVAGASGACFSLGLAASAPVVGRLMDLRGQAPVLVPCALVSTLGLLAIAVLPSDAPVAAIAALAVVTGLSHPPLGSCLRALWTRTIEPARRHAVFAIDSAATEATYVVGPVVLIGAIGGSAPQTALLVAAALVAVGVAAYVTRPAVRAWPAAPERTPSLLGPLSSGAVRVLLACVALVGVAFGTFEVGAAVVAEHAGDERLTGPLLAAWAIGSIGGAFLVARRPAPPDPAGRAAVLLAMVAAGQLPLIAVTGPLALGLLALLAGLSIAPALTTMLTLLGEITPPGTVTETFTWVTTGLTGGTAAGAALAGLVADVAPGAPFAVGACAVALAAALAAARRPVVRVALAAQAEAGGA